MSGCRESRDQCLFYSPPVGGDEKLWGVTSEGLGVGLGQGVWRQSRPEMGSRGCAPAGSRDRALGQGTQAVLGASRYTST